MASALTTQAPVMILVHVAWRAESTYTKWLGHPLVHVLLMIKARLNPQWHAINATNTPAHFWPKDEEAYKARTKANRIFGACECEQPRGRGLLCPMLTQCLEQEFVT